MDLTLNYSAGRLGLEKSLDSHSLAEWIVSKWKITFWLSLIYLVVIFSIQHFMQNRKPFQLRVPLVIWSSSLAAFSILGVLRCLPEFIQVVQRDGIHGSFCDASYSEHYIVKTWMAMFTISKIFELVDTLFIVLRKQSLVFLHWYHHITAMCMSFYAFRTKNGIGRWLMFMNFTVHSFMYSYFALRAAKVPGMSVFRVYITASQIVQMLIGFGGQLYTFAILLGLIAPKSVPCEADFNTAVSDFQTIPVICLVYGSYVFLFCRFFYVNYVRKPKKIIVNNNSNNNNNNNNNNYGSSKLTKSD